MPRQEGLNNHEAEQESLKPEEPVFKSPEERLVTDRGYEQYLNSFCMAEKELAGKKVLDIGSGISEFPVRANEKLKESGTMVVALDPMYASLGQNFEEFKDIVRKANMELVSKAKERDPKTAFEKIKSAPNKLAGSHQELPFDDESFDLVLANNSITQYEDRGITKKALEEAIRVTTEHGEIRVQPADLKWDKDAKSFYVCSFGERTDKTRKEADELGIATPPDREIFKILQGTENEGLNLYATLQHKRFGRHAMPYYSLILRKDEQVPNVNQGLLYKLSFQNSPDGFHMASEKIEVDYEKNK
jgi:ubiquinone/menaquinone biosynthesis C-methylase UbiE